MASGHRSLIVYCVRVHGACVKLSQAGREIESLGTQKMRALSTKKTAPLIAAVLKIRAVKRGYSAFGAWR